MSIVGLLVGVALFADVSTELLDRIIAVVGESPIFLSELRQRVRPHYFRVDAAGGDAAARTAAKAAVQKEVLERIIDERLEEREADKAHISVTPDEVDSGIKTITANAKLSKEELLAEVKRQGMTEQEYRDDVRRQILEGKLLQLRVRPKVKVTEVEAKSAYTTFVKELSGPNAPVDLRILVLRIAKDRATTDALAASIVSQAKSGTDFCTLVTKHTEDAATKSSCGSRGPLPRSQLLPDLAKAADALKPGEVSAPIAFKDPAGSEAVLVVQRAPGPPPAIPPFENVKEQMMERAFLEATERERKTWLADLRKNAYVEVKP